jgi:hypothetical protein
VGRCICCGEIYALVCIKGVVPSCEGVAQLLARTIEKEWLGEALDVQHVYDVLNRLDSGVVSNAQRSWSDEKYRRYFAVQV